ncbi:MAG: hypothetical protein JKY94_11635 [Rhodobacteraceae bacterium]|nr:hypothetical protein [Paracoccaceae bacterium]
MKEVDIENALGGQLEDNLTGLPSSVKWPNKDHDHVKPYLEVIFSGGQRRGGALKGGNTILRSSGVMLINVVTVENEAADPANEYADTLAELFIEGLRLSITGGTVLILKPADVRKGFRDGSDWKVPVVINYEATKT